MSYHVHPKGFCLLLFFISCHCDGSCPSGKDYSEYLFTINTIEKRIRTIENRNPDFGKLIERTVHQTSKMHADEAQAHYRQKVNSDDLRQLTGLYQDLLMTHKSCYPNIPSFTFEFYIAHKFDTNPLVTPEDRVAAHKERLQELSRDDNNRKEKSVFSLFGQLANKIEELNVGIMGQCVENERIRSNSQKERRMNKFPAGYGQALQKYNQLWSSEGKDYRIGQNLAKDILDQKNRMKNVKDAQARIHNAFLGYIHWVNEFLSFLTGRESK